jgi:hypothetical protein
VDFERHGERAEAMRAATGSEEGWLGILER